mgnify:CR=1 FL=1
MEGVESQKTKKVVLTRNKYTAEDREKARKYYIMGLNLHEISKLLDGCSVRTLEKWQNSERWTDLKQPQKSKIRALELSEAGYSYKEIAKMLKISSITVWRYIKQAKEGKLN